MALTGRDIMETQVITLSPTLDLLRALVDDRDAERGDPAYFRELFEISAPISASDWESAPQTLRFHHIHRVLVVEDDLLTGIITSFDLVGLLEKTG